jgi:hypothetical protein
METEIEIRVARLEERLAFLKEHADHRFCEENKAREQALQSVEKARELAIVSLEKRLESMNEFRAQLSRQANEFLTKEAFESRHAVVEEKLRVLEFSKALLEGKASQGSVNIALGFSVVGTLVAVIGVVLHFLK